MINEIKNLNESFIFFVKNSFNGENFQTFFNGKMFSPKYTAEWLLFFLLFNTKYNFYESQQFLPEKLSINNSISSNK